MSAARLARGYTGRAKILKFDGHYHGHADVFLKKAGSGVATLGIKTVGGIPTTTFDDTLVAAFNDVWGTTDHDVWAVGEDGAIVHFDGSTWSSIPSGTTASLGPLSGTSATDVWAGGIGVC